MQLFTVWANCSSPASVWNMMWRRRLWKSVQLEALVTCEEAGGLRGSAVGLHHPLSTLRPHGGRGSPHQSGHGLASRPQCRTCGRQEGPVPGWACPGPCSHGARQGQ